MKIIHANPGIGSVLSESQVMEFLITSKLNLRLGTIDDKGEPNIHPVWYLFENGKLYVLTGKTAKKTQNIRNKSIVYFCIDEENPPKGVRGKAFATILEDKSQLISIVEKIAIKYTGDLENNIAKLLVGMAKEVPTVILELEPKYFATWDHTGIS
jgi:hypothetical protein